MKHQNKMPENVRENCRKSNANKMKNVNEGKARKENAEVLNCLCVVGRFRDGIDFIKNHGEFMEEGASK